MRVGAHLGLTLGVTWALAWTLGLSDASAQSGGSADGSAESDNAADAGDEDEHPLTGLDAEGGAGRGSNRRATGTNGVEVPSAETPSDDVAESENAADAGDENEHPFTGIEEEDARGATGDEASQSGAPGRRLSGDEVELQTQFARQQDEDPFVEDCIDQLEELKKSGELSPDARLKISEEVLDIKRSLRDQKLNPRKSGNAHRWLKRVCVAQGLKAPEYPEGTIPLGSVKTVLRISGFVYFDAYWGIGMLPADLFDPDRTNQEVGDLDSADSFAMNLRRSRLRVQSFTPTEWGQLHTQISMDFSGGGGGLGSSFNPRLRRAFAEIGGLLIGQSWTNFTGNFSPNTVDSSGPQGTVAFRQAQIRWTQPVGKALRVIGSLERPLSTGFNGAKNVFPDIVGTFNLTTVDTAANLSAIYSQLRYELSENASNASGWGVAGNVGQAFGGTLLQGGVVYGDGIGRYISGGEGTTTGGGVGDAYIDPDTGALTAVSLLGWSAAVQQELGKYVVVNVVYGETRGGRPADDFPDGMRLQRSAVGNVWVTPLDPVTVGLGYYWAWRQLNSGDTRTGQKPEISVQVNF